MSQKGKVEIEVTANTHSAEVGIGRFSLGLKSINKIFDDGIDLARKFAHELVEMAKVGSDYDELKVSFDNLAQSIGRNSDEMLGRFREATGGMVNNMDLVRQANEAMMRGMDMGQFEQILSMSESIADATGNSQQQVIETVTTAIARQRTMGLESIGITMDVTRANEEYAASIGKTAAQLTEAEKKTAFANAAIKSMRSDVDRLGPGFVSLGDRMQMAQVRMENMRLMLGRSFAPAVSTVYESISGLMERFGAIAGGGSTQRDVENGLDKISLAFAKFAIYVKGYFSALFAYTVEFWSGIFQGLDHGVTRLRDYANILKETLTGGDVQAAIAAYQSHTRTIEDENSKRIGALNAFIREFRIANQEIEQKEREYADRARRRTSGTTTSTGTSTERGSSSGGSGISDKDLQQLGSEQMAHIDSEEAALAAGAKSTAMQGLNIIGQTLEQGFQIQLQKLQQKQQVFDYMADYYVKRVMDQAQQEIDIEKAKYDQLKANQDQYYADKLASLESSILSDAEKAREKIAIQKDQAAAQAKLEAEKNQKLAQLEAEKQAKAKELQKQQAVIGWMFKSAELELQKRMEITKNTISGISNAAQAFAGATASLGIPIGPIVGAGLSSMILSNMGAANAMVSSQFVLPPPELFAASGAIVNRPTVAMIGETGPEAVVPLGGMSGGGVNVSIHVENMFADNDSAVRLASMIDRELRTLHINGKSLFGAEVTA